MDIVRLLVVFLCIIAMFGCSKPIPKDLPGDWPIPELTLPEGSDLAGPIFMPQDMPGVKLDDSWTAYFNCPLTYGEVAEHVESCLGKVGYKRLIIGNVEERLDDEVMRDYYSSSGLVNVILASGVDPAIVKNKKLSADYHLTITLLKEPDGLLQMVGKTDKLTLLDLK